MVSFKQFSLTYLIIVIIFGFMLVSSFVNASRALDGDGVVPRDYTDDCKFVGACKDGSDCTSQCEHQNFHDGGRCIDDPRVHRRLRCCCIAAY
ncbi:hypothetical protein MKW94_018268 [Papaver nudicaule]|uniref:Uncharacterized protein n=1 Tax=Papaver nudicaule TaxID=74823 RepID=A0AA41VT68_PAPNU|nr:hypothetical protein [Papaver nudicaule]